MWATFERFELEMTMEQARSASHPGQCDEDVADLCKNPKIRRQLAKIPDDKLAAELREYGAWNDEELQDRETNELRIVWLAAEDIVEEYNQKRRG